MNFLFLLLRFPESHQTQFLVQDLGQPDAMNDHFAHPIGKITDCNNLLV
jgi:hypothetical protein